MRKFSETFITIICSEIERNGDGYEHWRPYWIKVAPSSRWGEKKKKDDWFDSYTDYSMHWLKWENDRLFFLFFCFLVPWK